MRSGLTIAIMFVLVLTGSAGVSHGIEREDFDAVVDFEHSLKSVSRAVREGTGEIPRDRLVVLDGVVSAVEILDAEEESFRARIELLRGEWRELEEIITYNAYVDLGGSRFRDRFPERAGRGATSAQIGTHSEVLVVARFTGTEEDDRGNPVPVFEGLYLRILPD